MDSSQTSSKIGIVLVLSAFVIWGLSPLYFKLLTQVSPLEILAQRAIWSLLFLLVILLIQKQFNQIFATIKIVKYRYLLFITTALISTNWLIFIWAILNNYIMEASLGYFLTPLLNIILGVLFLNEKLTFIQKISLILTLGAISIQIFSAQFLGAGPWISLGLATTFGIYTLVRKKIAVSSVVGLSVETLYLFPFALCYLIYITLNQKMIFLTSENISLLLMLGGIITALPLLLFVAGSKYLPLSSVGFFQYIAPTGQLLLAIFVFNEKVDSSKMISFSLVWIALGIYILHTIFQIYQNKNQRKMSRT
ncbi:EamA family transporter RarD [Fluviispira multicolorata]|uniref:EamA family transporter RarD n=1 Tax=Fluviispira multicolorata TaxID=2654512 RepID=UPI001375499A|nr:EamA family transporter RarD [Fluviispira multicolorata]